MDSFFQSWDSLLGQTLQRIFKGEKQQQNKYSKIYRCTTTSDQ